MGALRRSVTAVLLATAVGAGSPLGGAAAAAGDPSKAGAYCPLPKAGEVPKCLYDAQETYEGFFLGLEEGSVDDVAAAQVEAAVTGGSDAQRYDALSSLSYGYFMLARAAANSEEPSPRVRARLERWNALLTEAYRTNEDPRYRDAVREAAVDLQANAPAVGLRCTDAEGNPAECSSTEGVVRAIDLARQQSGLRGALGRLLGALLGGDEED